LNRQARQDRQENQHRKKNGQIITQSAVNNLLPSAFHVRGGEMETRLSLAPGQNGTKKLLARYGERLVCVRYRYDAARKVRHKTVELIVETAPWNPRQRNARREPHDMVAVRIEYSETALRERIKMAGGIWRHRQRLWEVDWKTVRELGLQRRVVAQDPR
jgi:hypothetical protein